MGNQAVKQTSPSSGHEKSSQLLQKHGGSLVTNMERVPKVVLTKMILPKNFDFNAVATIRLKSLYTQLPGEGQGHGLLTNGISRNTKRMRFHTKTIPLDDDE